MGEMSAVERAAEVIATEYGPCNDDVNHDGREPMDAAEALAADGLLVDDDTERLVRRSEALAEILGELWLYVDWRYFTKQLTTEQKELWADCVDAWTAKGSTAVDRWWRPDAIYPEAGVEGGTT